MRHTLKRAMACAALLMLAACNDASVIDEEAFANESRAAVEAFGGALKTELMRAMAEDGAAAAITVCNEAAPVIAANVSADAGLDVGRTSLRVRNPDNAPDAWERAVLQGFEDARGSGVDVATLEHVERVSIDGRAALRYMKAIPMAPLCSACHGSDLAPDVSEAIDAHYPDDQARGYSVGDIRGAFTVIDWID